MLTLSLFGPGQATYCDRTLTGFPHQRPCLLLCYLLLDHRRLHSRDHLAAVFWGDEANDLARKALRNALWRLRQLFREVGANLGDYLSADDERVGFSPNGGGYWLDIEAFETSITRYTKVAAEQLLPAQVSEMENALELYRGELLEGIYDDWCLCERERLYQLYTGALSKLMHYYGGAGHPELGIDYGRRILALDNTHESVHRQIMQLLWQTGDRCAALGQYKLCCQILQDELDVPPTAETRSLYEQILHDGSGATARWQHSHVASKPVVETHAVSPGAELLAELRRAKSLVVAANAALTHLEAAIGDLLPDALETPIG